jgi:catechol 2,3-dioxygenase-like lactoylglutathione lyase family enzyme
VTHLLHHVSLPVHDLRASAQFYDAMMQAIGYRRVFTADSAVG